VNYIVHLLTTLSIFGLLAISLDLLVGYAGLLALSHGAFFGIGAYATAILTKQGLAAPLAAAIGMGLAACVSALVALPSWRVRGVYLLIVSMAVQIVFTVVAVNWTEVTNGSAGIPGIPAVSLFGEVLRGTPYMLFCAAVLALCVLFCSSLMRSPYGRVVQAMREDEMACEALGKNIAGIKISIFAVSGSLAALAGSLYAHYISYVDPKSFDIELSILILLMVMVGGAGTPFGPLLGALALTLLPEALKFIDLPPGVGAATRQAFYGVTLIVLMMFRPQGLLGLGSHRAGTKGRP
jgi:ABC-type branched-subunit amino acid transport system permease subunit